MNERTDAGNTAAAETGFKKLGYSWVQVRIGIRKLALMVEVGAWLGIIPLTVLKINKPLCVCERKTKSGRTHSEDVYCLYVLYVRNRHGTTGLCCVSTQVARFGFTSDLFVQQLF